MVLKLFGLKRKPKPDDAGNQSAQTPPVQAADEVVEFQEVDASGTILSPPAARAPAKPSAPSKLTPKQRAQRKYAAQMKTVRKRAKTAKGGNGRIAKRSGATKLRRDLGLKPGKPTKKAKPSRKKR